MTEDILEKIKAALAKGDRVMLVPAKGGVRIFEIKQKEIK